MAEKTLFLNEELYQYFLSISVREDQLLKALSEETQQFPRAKMQSAKEVGQLLTFLVKLINAKKSIDIGTFTGFSALSMARGMPEHGIVVTCEVNEDTTKVARHYWEQANLSHKIQLKLAPAVDTLEQLLKHEAGTFDFIFIDADKKNNQIYYEQSLKLLRRGGLIVIDNIFKDGKAAVEAEQTESIECIKKLNKFLHQDNRIDLSVLPMGDGLTLARKH